MNISAEEIKEQFLSFTQAFATAIDERTPYNGNHTRKVTAYVQRMAECMNILYERGQCTEYFDDNRMEQVMLAATLHDIGKMVVPLEVMDKSTRLGCHMVMVKERFRLIRAYIERDFYRGDISEDEMRDRCKYLDASLSFLEDKNQPETHIDEDIPRIREIGSCVYVDPISKEEIPYLTEYELECMCIPWGTLTSHEREIMAGHAAMTHKILEKVHYCDFYSDILSIASDHHEFLDGSGYPNHLKGDEISIETRMLTIADIYDALTAKDRPYKEPMEMEKAFEVLESMAEEGKLDKDIIEIFKMGLTTSALTC